MKRAIAFLLALGGSTLLTASCGGPPRGGGGEEAALEAYARGDFDAAEAALAGRKDDFAHHVRARILLLKNRNREALEAIQAIRDKDASVYPDLALAYVRLDDFLNASKVAAFMGEAIVAKKYEMLARTVAYATDGAWEETSAPFLIAEPLPVIEVTVHGRPGRFMIDTGQDEILLDRDFAKRCGVEAIGLQGGKGAFDEGTVREMTVGRVTVRNVPVHIGRAAKVGAIQTDGAIGVLFLMHYEFTLDYRRGRLVLRRAGGPAAGQPAYFAGDRHLLAAGTMNGTVATFVGFGTGLAGVTLAASEPFLQARGGDVRELRVGPVRLVKPSLDLLAFPTGLDGAFGVPVGFVLGHQALRGRVLRLEPRSMKLTIE